ncbi:hypothetical protein M3Y97_00972100 [Aphelenchoides bicaudatus]|nr:hypothetical protein M3Y97_00972100 [Aphelenchoides bicaudatus]
MLSVTIWGATMEGVTLQVLLALIMFLTTAAAGLLPLKVLQSLAKKGSDNRVSSWILTLLSCFAGGVFLATCFLDIFPHVNSGYEKYKKDYNWNNDYPLPEFMACLGFFFVYFIEELSLKVFAKHGHSHHGHAHGNQNKNLDPQVVMAVDQPLKMQTNLNGSTVIHSTKSLDEGMGELERKFSVINTHEAVMNQSVQYLNEKEGDFLKSLTFAFAMSFHSILEGFALGVQNSKAGILTLFLSLIIHKGIEAFSVGLQVSRSNSKRLMLVVTTILVYALMTPVGSMLGVLLTNSTMETQTRDLVIILLEGCASGTFIFVTFFEVLAHERANDHSNLVQLAAIVVGFFLIAGLQASEHFTDSDDSGNAHVHG